MKLNVLGRCAVMLMVLLLACQSQYKAGRFGGEKSFEVRVSETVTRLKTEDPGLNQFFDNARGYAVFPTVGKAAWIIGGAHGKGLLYEGGKIAGHTSLTQISLGAQWGGQAFIEVIFFADDASLGDFKRGNFELGAQVSAVALTAGASADVDYESGVAIFTLPKGGLMFDVSVGGQKFSFSPY